MTPSSKWTREINDAIEAFEASVAAFWRGDLGETAHLVLPTMMSRFVAAQLREHARRKLPRPAVVPTRRLSELATRFTEATHSYCAKRQRGDADRRALFDEAIRISGEMLDAAKAERARQVGVVASKLNSYFTGGGDGGAQAHV